MAGATTKRRSVPRLSLPVSAAAAMSATCCAASAASDDARVWKKAPAMAAAAGDVADEMDRDGMDFLASDTPVVVDGGVEWRAGSLAVGLSMAMVAMVAIGA